MGELIDILPHIEEANEFSKVLDKKVKFSAMAVSSASRGDYNNHSKVNIQTVFLLTRKLLKIYSHQTIIIIFTFHVLFFSLIAKSQI